MPLVLPPYPTYAAWEFWRDHRESHESAGHESRKSAAFCSSFKPTIRGRLPAMSAAPSSPPFVGDHRRRPRLTQARRLREIDAIVRGSPRPTDRGRSKPPSVAHPGLPIAGDIRRRPRLPQVTPLASPPGVHLASPPARR